jgi:ribose transport system substrate-binding protein
MECELCPKCSTRGKSMHWTVSIGSLALLAMVGSAASGAVPYATPQALSPGSQAPMPAVRVKTGAVQIAFLPPASTLNFYRPLGAGVQAVAKMSGALVTELAPQEGTDTYAQAGMIQDAISRGVDAIIITTHDEHAAAPLLKRAVDRGIVVVITNSDIRSFPTPIHAVVGYSQRKAMWQLGQYVTQYVSKASGTRPLNLGLIEGLPGYHNAERMDGFLSGIDPTKLKVIGRLSGSWTVEGGNTASLDLLQAHPEIGALIAANDDMALGSSLTAKSLAKHLITTGADGQTPALEAIASGEMTATVDATPYVMGEIAMQVALDSLAGKFKGGWVETTIVVRDVANVLEVLRQPEMLFPKPSKKY